MSTSNPNRGFEAIAGQIWSPEAHRSSPLPQPDVMIDVAHGGRSACGCMWCAMRENATRRTHFFAAGHGENLPYSRETTHSSCCSDSTRYGFSPQSLASPARLAPVAVARARGQALREGAQFLRRPQRPEHCTFACLTCTRARPLLPAPCSLFCAGRGDALVIFCKRATELLREAFSRPFLAPPFRHAASAMFRHFIFVCGAPFFPSPTLQRAALRTAQSVWRAVHAHVRCVRPRSRHRAHAACLPALVTPPPLLRLPGWSTDRAAVIALPSSRRRVIVLYRVIVLPRHHAAVTALPSPCCRHRAAVTALPRAEPDSPLPVRGCPPLPPRPSPCTLTLQAHAPRSPAAVRSPTAIRSRSRLVPPRFEPPPRSSPEAPLAPLVRGTRATALALDSLGPGTLASGTGRGRAYVVYAPRCGAGGDTVTLRSPSWHPIYLMLTAMRRSRVICPTHAWCENQPGNHPHAYLV